MAIARGAGTEIIRSALFEGYADGPARPLIIGVQHHVYTVLSVTFFCVARAATTHYGNFRLLGFDAFGGATGQVINIARIDLDANETFVWNDKFSFNGAEPTGVSTILSTVAEQDAISDQGTATSQHLTFDTDHAGTNFDITVTYIDQNNA